MFPVGAALQQRCTQHKGRLRRAYKSVFCRDDKELSGNLSRAARVPSLRLILPELVRESVP
jgi:hypothetical protein